MPPLKIILCGYGPLGLALLKGLLAAKKQDLCKVVAVFRWSDVAIKGTFKMPEHFLESEEAALAKLCQEENIERLNGNGLNGYSFSAQLLRLQPDVVLVGSWGEILRAHVLQGPKPLFINCHPSLLPTHRGANPYASVILAGEAETGISFHRIVQAIDAGPILLQKTVPLDDDDTGATVRKHCSDTAEEMVPELMRQLHRFFYEHAPLAESHQNEQHATLFYAPLPKDAQIHWHQEAMKLSRFIRARYPWALAYSPFLYGLLRVYLGPSRLVEEEGDTDVSQNSGRHIPGKILSHNQAGLLVATSNPRQPLLIEEFSLSIGPWRFPDWLSLSLGKVLLRPGLKF